MAPAALAGDQNKICSCSTRWALNVTTPSPLVLCRMLQRPKCFWTHSTRVQQQVLADESPRLQGNVEINTTVQCGFCLPFFSLCCIGRKTKRGEKNIPRWMQEAARLCKADNPARPSRRRRRRKGKPVQPPGRMNSFLRARKHARPCKGCAQPINNTREKPWSRPPMWMPSALAGRWNGARTGVRGRRNTRYDLHKRPVNIRISIRRERIGVKAPRLRLAGGTTVKDGREREVSQGGRVCSALPVWTS